MSVSAIATHQFSKSKAGHFTEIRGCLAANCTSAPVQLQSEGSKGRASNPACHLYACYCRKPCCVFEPSQRSNSAESRTLSCKYASVFFLINTWVVRNKSISILQSQWCKTARFKNSCYTSNTLQDLVAPGAWIVRNEKLHPAAHAV